MPIATSLTKRAIAIARAGKKSDARKILQEVLRLEPKNEKAWLWYVDTFSDQKERIVALRQLLQALPDHPYPTKALASLERPVPERQISVPGRKPQTLVGVVAILVVIVGICAILFGSAGLINTARYRLAISNLEAQNDSLNSHIADLSNQIDALNIQYQELQNEYRTLQDIAIVPPYISISNRNMLIGFTKTDQTLDR